MPPTPQQEAIPVEDSYLELMKEAIESAGGQTKVARDVGINQSTVSKSLSRRVKLTYTTMAKLARYLNLPEPVTPVRDVAHATWCKIGARLQVSKPAVFSIMLSAALEAMDAAPPPPSDESLERLREVVSDPMPRSRKPSRKT
jgi:DNA-binding phage protein